MWRCCRWSVVRCRRRCCSVLSARTLITTITTTTTTTTTTLAPTTSAPPTTTATTLAPVPVTPDQTPVQQSTDVTTATTIARARTSVTTPSTTTLAPIPTTTLAPTTTTTTIPAPVAPETGGSGSGALVDGEEVETVLTRNNNALVVSGAGIEATVYGLSSDDVRIDLDEDGLLRLADTDRIVVEADGYAPGEPVEVWMYSTPTRLGVLTVDALGGAEASFLIPAGLEPGEHRIVLAGRSERGQDVVLGIGIALGEVEQSSLLSRLLIIVPVSLAVIMALIIPTTLRRRREERANG